MEYNPPLSCTLDAVQSEYKVIISTVLHHVNCEAAVPSQQREQWSFGRLCFVYALHNAFLEHNATFRVSQL
jgi:hypothetical protein